MNMLRHSTILLVYLSVAACSYHQDNIHPRFEDAVEGIGLVEISGWANLSGEVKIYSDKAAMLDGSKYPKCISGVFKDHEHKNLKPFEGRRVRIVGTIFRYHDLPEEKNTLLPRKMLDGTVIPNFCFGKNVILLKSIQIF